MPPRLSIVVPTYNEPALESLLARLPDAEVIVVDDSDVPPVLANARVIRGDQRGKGDAVRLGMLAAEGDIVFHLDADVDDAWIAKIPELVRLIEEGHDLAVAERRSRWEFRSALRGVLSIGLFLAQRYFIFQSHRFFDTQCGFKAYRRDAARAIASKQRVSGGMFDIEHLYIALKNGMRVAQIDVPPMREVRPSRINVARCVYTDPIDLVRVKWNGLLGRYTQ